uniref:Uncharacterized protein n=1 Tax=Anguilla anguilla TaxID=7936 RepID=A0A0E9WNJ7_ANGAN
MVQSERGNGDAQHIHKRGFNQVMQFQSSTAAEIIGWCPVVLGNCARNSKPSCTGMSTIGHILVKTELKRKDCMC